MGGEGSLDWCFTAAGERSECLEAALEPMPTVVLHRLFLGSRAEPHTTASLGRFGISHVLVASSFPQASRLPGVHYSEVPLAEDVARSEAEGGMLPLWEAAAASINEGLQAGGVVMVMV